MDHGLDNYTYYTYDRCVDESKKKKLIGAFNNREATKNVMRDIRHHQTH